MQNNKDYLSGVFNLGVYLEGEIGASNEVRTRDLNLGKVALYQLSYTRVTYAF